jgi:hypothetical protein
MIASVLLFLALQDPDLSEPGKTLDSLASAMSELMRGTQKIPALRQSLDERGDELFNPEEKLRRIERRKELLQSYPPTRMLGISFERITMPDVKAEPLPVDAVQVIRVEIVDPKTGQKRETAMREATRVGFVKNDGRWLIRSLHQACKLCDGKGLCFVCEGTGKDQGVACRDCGGRKTCDSCKGAKEKDQTIPDFSFQLVSEKDFAFSSDLSSPEGAARSFADFLTKKMVEESKAELQGIRPFLLKYRACLAPEVSKALGNAFAKAVDAGADRFKTRRPKVESLEKKETGAAAIVREPVPPGLENLRFKDFDHRILLKKVGGRWLIDRDQMGCACLGREAACPECKGTGWINR